MSFEPINLNLLPLKLDRQAFKFLVVPRDPVVQIGAIDGSASLPLMSEDHGLEVLIRRPPHQSRDQSPEDHRCPPVYFSVQPSQPQLDQPQHYKP
jgi:hypothetical protein